MLTGTMTASIAFMPAKMTCSTTTKLSQMMRNVLMFIAANARVGGKDCIDQPLEAAGLVHAGLQRSTQSRAAGRPAKQTCPLRSLNVHTPMPGQSIRKMVMNTI